MVSTSYTICVCALSLMYNVFHRFENISQLWCQSQAVQMFYQRWCKITIIPQNKIRVYVLKIQRFHLWFCFLVWHIYSLALKICYVLDVLNASNTKCFSGFTEKFFHAWGISRPSSDSSNWRCIICYSINISRLQGIECSGRCSVELFEVDSEVRVVRPTWDGLSTTQLKIFPPRTRSLHHNAHKRWTTYGIAWRGVCDPSAKQEMHQHPTRTPMQRHPCSANTAASYCGHQSA